MRAHLMSFLATWGAPDAAELDLWEAALAPAPGNLVEALATWLRLSPHKPKPVEIRRIMQAHARPLSMERIALDVALEHGITLAELTGPARHRRQAWPRQEAMARMHEAGYSLSQIARFLDRDHTTILHGVRAHKARQQEAQANA